MNETPSKQEVLEILKAEQANYQHMADEYDDMIAELEVSVKENKNE